MLCKKYAGFRRCRSLFHFKPHFPWWNILSLFVKSIHFQFHVATSLLTFYEPHSSKGALRFKKQNICIYWRKTHKIFIKQRVQYYLRFMDHFTIHKSKYGSHVGFTWKRGYPGGTCLKMKLIAIISFTWKIITFYMESRMSCEISKNFSNIHLL